MFLKNKTKRSVSYPNVAYVTLRETQMTQWKRLFIRDFKALKGQSSSSVQQRAVKKLSGGFKETIEGNYYGARSKEVAGHSRAVQEREAGYTTGN